MGDSNNAFIAKFRNFLFCRNRGAVAVEYGLIAAMIAVVTIVSVGRAGGSISDKLGELGIGVGENPDVPPSAGDSPVPLGGASGPSDQPVALGGSAGPSDQPVPFGAAPPLD